MDNTGEDNTNMVESNTGEDNTNMNHTLESNTDNTDDFSPTDVKEWDNAEMNQSILTEQKRKTIYCISDIHAEFYDDNMNILYDKLKQLPHAMYLVLAGDICDPLRYEQRYINILNYLKDKYRYIILVAGNHEYYGCNKQRELVIPELQKICDKTGVVLLNRTNIVVNGVRFIGATLWSLIDKSAFDMLNDSRYVFNNIIEYSEAFIDDYRFIRDELLKVLDTDEPVVVVTHHLPTKKLVHPRYKDHPANTGFCSNVLDLVMMNKVKYWFCGHTHEHMETKYGDTKLLVNPMGYPHEVKFTNIKLNTMEL